MVAAIGQAKVLKLNCWEISKGQVPFRTEPLIPEYGGEDLSVLYPRMERDGWRRISDHWGLDHTERFKFDLESLAPKPTRREAP